MAEEETNGHSRVPMETPWWTSGSADPRDLVSRRRREEEEYMEGVC